MAESTTRYRALLFGNQTYDSGYANLSGPRVDVARLERALTDPQVGLHRAEDVETHVDFPHQQMLASMHRFFTSALPTDQLLFYFAGHGDRDLYGRLYLCARDSRQDALPISAVSSDLVNGLIDNSPAQRFVIILDCCHSGQFRSTNLPDAVEGTGRFVLASCRSSDLAQDESIFTETICEALLDADADENSDGLISVHEVYNYVARFMKQHTKQTPQRSLQKAVGDIYLARAPDATSTQTLSGTAEPARRPELRLSKDEIIVRDLAPGAVVEETVSVLNFGGGTLTFRAEASADWITLSPGKDHINVAMTPPASGTHRGIVTVHGRDDAGTERLCVELHVRREVRDPELEVRPQRLDFGTVSLGSETAVLRLGINNLGDGELEATVSSNHPQVEARLVGDSVEVRLDAREAGAIEAAITVESKGGTAEIPVRARVWAAPVLHASPRKVDFGKVPLGQSPVEHVTVKNRGEGALDWQVRASGDFYSVERSGGKVRLRISSAAAAGNHRGTLSITSNGGDAVIDVRADIEAPAAVALRPDPQATFVGEWEIIITVMGILSSPARVSLLPNGQVTGQQSLFGIPVSMNGRWMFEPEQNLLYIEVWGDNANQFMIQITGGDQNGYVGQDAGGMPRSYTLKKLS